MAIIKTPVDIDGMFLIDGTFEIRAMRLYDEGSRWIRVRMLERRPEKGASRKIGVAGWRYKCVALRGIFDDAPVEHPFSLWREGDNFFVEKDEPEESG